MKNIIKFFRELLECTEVDEFKSCAYLGSSECNKCPKFKECVNYFKDK